MAASHRLKNASFPAVIWVFLHLFQCTRATSTSILPTATSNPAPTAVIGDAKYSLLGCYVEPPLSANARVLGPAGTYFTPIVDLASFTVSTCLNACGIALPGGVGTTYAGVENTKECYCSPAFASNITYSVNLGDCTSACAGNATQACGGYGFMSAYQLISTLNSTSPNITLPSSSPSTSSTPSPHHHLSGGAIAGVVIGTLIGATILLLIGWFCLRQHKRQQEDREKLNTLIQNNPSPTAVHDNSPVFSQDSHDTRRNGMFIPGSSLRPWVVQDPTLDDGVSSRAGTARSPTAPSSISPVDNYSLHTAPQSRRFRDSRDMTGFVPHEEHTPGPSELDSATATMVGSPTYEQVPAILEGFEGSTAIGTHESVGSWGPGDDEMLKRGFMADVQTREDRFGRAELPVPQANAPASGDSRLSELPTPEGAKESAVESADSPILPVGRPAFAEERVEGSMSATGGWSPAETAAKKLITFRDTVSPLDGPV